MVFWIEDLQSKRILIDGKHTKEKALRIYNQLQELEPSTSLQATKKLAFNANEGWLTGFIKRHAFHNVKIKEEVASADENAAKTIPDKLAKIVEEGYTPEQIFNADETGLFWKKMLERTYIAKSEKSAGGFKAAKDRVTFLL
ncbi:tigger transposable element-derived protein 1-like [Onthophagus taurus]|uniref:tigger transposable element-derived protein 1-like n=1 Tax=Onthophagus taurus TaxID=166361 RepID=UPI0039BDD0DA